MDLLVSSQRIKSRPLITIVLVVSVFLFLSWFFSNIFVYFVISLVLATILRPLTNYLSKTQLFKIQMPRVVAVFASFMVMLSLISMFVFLFVPLISEQIEIFAGLDYERVFSTLYEPIQTIERFIIKYNLAHAAESGQAGFLMENIRSSVLSFFQDIDITVIVNNILSLTGSLFISLMAIVFITFFLLYENGLLRRHFINIIPNQYFEVSISGLYKIEKLLSNYLTGLLLQMLAVFSIAFIGLSAFGIKYSATIALFAAVANIIPYLGPILGSVFGLFVGISTSPEIFANNSYLFLIIKIVTVFATVQLTDNLVLQPLIFSKSVKAHPLEIFIVIFAGATLAGIPGMIAAIPVYTIVRVSAIEIFRGYKSYKIFKI